MDLDKTAFENVDWSKQTGRLAVAKAGVLFAPSFDSDGTGVLSSWKNIQHRKHIAASSSKPKVKLTLLQEDHVMLTFGSRKDLESFYSVFDSYQGLHAHEAAQMASLEASTTEFDPEESERSTAMTATPSRRTSAGNHEASSSLQFQWQRQQWWWRRRSATAQPKKKKDDEDGDDEDWQQFANHSRNASPGGSQHAAVPPLTDGTTVDPLQTTTNICGANNSKSGLDRCGPSKAALQHDHSEAGEPL